MIDKEDEYGVRYAMKDLVPTYIIKEESNKGVNCHEELFNII